MRLDSDVAIQVEGISKLYRLGAGEDFQDSLGAAVVHFIKSPIRNYRKYRSLYKFNDVDSTGEAANILWALKDVSFEVPLGQSIGVIGRNGAGKSTLLKILSRITPPTTGIARIHGRISSLLEVGTGFHPELTGRENVYLNGTVLGMKKREVDSKFDEIVDFSGVEKFLDTPVKRYSSGMKVRLAFAVAAHLDPEILIVDEVLAVGDAEFQRKCLNKMKDVGKHGRTVIFVSHNMAAISKLCGRALWMNGGRLIDDGPASSIVASYLNAGTEGHAIWKRSDDGKGEKGHVKLAEARLTGAKDGKPTTVMDFDKGVNFEIIYEVKKPNRDIVISAHVMDSEGNILWVSADTDTTDWKGRTREPGQYVSICQIPPCLLRPGRYHLSAGYNVRRNKEKDLHTNIITFDVSDVGYLFEARRRPGMITPLLEWEVRKLMEGDDLTYRWGGYEAKVVARIGE
jgi:ABC-type polysaccharide/polyol phosphate transport system, ATPase component